MSRAAIYARFSSDRQRNASIEDQVRLCRERLERDGHQLVQTYVDRAQSGASMLRGGLQALIEDAMAAQFDVVVTEALDRLSRDQADIAALHKRLAFAGVSIVTLAEGPINELHIGLKGTMNQLFLKDLADKTRRGLRGRVEAGRSGGGRSYGYDVVRAFATTGEPQRGERVVNEAEAAIVRRIFGAYAAGASPRAIAASLNAEGVLGPSGEAWGSSTIHGNPKRGTGLLNNELYLGRLVWNRLRYVKDPVTGKRVSRPNPPEAWIKAEVPDLRIVEDALWQRARMRQSGLRKRGTAFWQKQRPRMLLSHLLKCGCCGGGFSKISQDRYGCSTARNKNTCQNRLTIRQDVIEGRVVRALQAQLMDPELLKVFCVEYTAHLNALRGAATASREATRQELAKLERDRARLIQAIKDGIPASEVRDDLARITSRREALEAEIAGQAEPPPVLMHPSMAEIYRRKVADLAAALNAPEDRAEAADLLRSLIERIVLTPADGQLTVDLYGDLAGILGMAANKNGPLQGSDPLVQQVKLVAGARNLLGRTSPTCEIRL